MTADKKRGGVLPGLMTLIVLAGASMAGASRSGVPEIVTQAKQMVFGQPNDGGTAPATPPSSATATAPVSATGPGGPAQGRGHTPVSSQGVGPNGVPPSHAGGNGKDHAGGNEKGNGTPPADPGSKGQGPAQSGTHSHLRGQGSGSVKNNPR